jgi:hypothetical protein
MEGRMLYSVLCNYFHLVQPGIELATANPDNYRGVTGDFIRIYQFRNQKSHDPNLNVSFDNINKIIKSTIVCYLEFADTIKGDILRVYNSNQIASQFDKKKYAQDLINEYNSSEFSKSYFLNTKWYDPKANSAQYDVATILNIKPLQLKMLGEPGAGKSTALLKIENNLAKRIAKGDNALIPVRINLGTISLDDNIIVNAVKNTLKTDFDTALQGIENNDFCLLLDGYNEILDLDTQRKFAGELDVLISRFPKLSVILTDRAVTAPRIKVMSNARCLYLFNLTNDDKLLYFQKNASKPETFEIIKRNPLSYQLLNTPLKLKHFLALTEKNGRVPVNFTEEYIEMIFEREMLEKKDMNLNYLPSYLEALAISERPFTVIKALSVIAKVNNVLGYTIPDSMVCLDLAINMGILSKNEGELDFTEEEFADYFLVKAAESGIDEVL